MDHELVHAACRLCKSNFYKSANSIFRSIQHYFSRYMGWPAEQNPGCHPIQDFVTLSN